MYQVKVLQVKSKFVILKNIYFMWNFLKTFENYLNKVEPGIVYTEFLNVLHNSLGCNSIHIHWLMFWIMYFVVWTSTIWSWWLCFVLEFLEKTQKMPNILQVMVNCSKTTWDCWPFWTISCQYSNEASQKSQIEVMENNS